jgi:hypothetical protein
MYLDFSLVNGVKLPLSIVTGSFSFCQGFFITYMSLNKLRGSIRAILAIRYTDMAHAKPRNRMNIQWLAFDCHKHPHVTCLPAQKYQEHDLSSPGIAAALLLGLPLLGCLLLRCL